MFEAFEIGHKLTREEYDAQEPPLRTALLATQQLARDSKRAVIVLVAGVEGAGKGEVVGKLNEWLDTHFVQTHAFWDQADKNDERPPFWRFWQCLPARDNVGVMFGSWYTDPIIEFAAENIGKARFERALQRIVEFEQAITQDGAIIAKFWFHLSKKSQKERLAQDKEQALKPVSKVAAKNKYYRQFTAAAERAIRSTDTVDAPWFIVEAENAHYRDLTFGATLLHYLQKRLANGNEPRAGVASSTPTRTPAEMNPTSPVAPSATPSMTLLNQLDLTQALDPDHYESRLKHLQSKLRDLSWRARDARLSSVIVFEGWDAAGKGSAIRRVTQPMDPRLYRVIPTSTPTDEERSHHYLWRFWRHIPPRGYMTIYDRSWYGRVLVERVENFANANEWGRAYQEINDFEEQLTEQGILLVKFWLHIDVDTQRARFREREQTPHKQHKIGPADYRNLELRAAYESAVTEMIARTSTSSAPWQLIAANDKPFARISVMETLCARLQEALRK